MTTEQAVTVLSQIPFVIIAAITVAQAIQRPRRSTIDIAILFSAFTIIILNSWIASALGFAEADAFSLIQLILLTTLPYLLLRVVSDFMDVPRAVQISAAATLAVIVTAEIATGAAIPWWLLVMEGAYFAAIGIYATIAFVSGSRASRGVTARRMHAAAAGSAFLGLTIVVAVLRTTIPTLDTLATEALTRVLTVAIGVSYFVAFSPPRALRQFWQQPELRRILARVAILPRLPSTELIVQELENGAGAATGAPGASIGLYDREHDELVFVIHGEQSRWPSSAAIAGRAFTSQKAIFTENASRDDPDYADAYKYFQAAAILAAPISAGSERLGVLTVYAARPPIFAEDDLQLVQMLADQAAVILESRALIDATTRVRAREQATLLRDEFLTAAAHDLRTPLTALIGRTQLIRRRVQRQPDLPIDPAEITLIEHDLLRLNSLIGELLDATRAEHGQLVGERERVDLVTLVRQAQTQHHWDNHRCCIDAPRQLLADVAPVRFVQLVHNMLENAIKYSPNGGDIRVTLAKRGDMAIVTVSDDGVGIPEDDLPYIFDRFHRAGNVDQSAMSGLGLGLYICRAIVEEHGGRITVESTYGKGTTFSIELPLVATPIVDRTSSPTADSPAPTAL